MSDGINKAILVGLVGKAPDYKNTGSVEITRVSLATTKTFKDRNSGEKKKSTDWHDIIFFGYQAQLAAELISKGAKLYVEGEIKNNKYTDKNGVDKTSSQIQASKFLLLSERKQNENRGNSTDYADPKALYTPNGNTIEDDDIPF